MRAALAAGPAPTAAAWRDSVPSSHLHAGRRLLTLLLKLYLLWLGICTLGRLGMLAWQWPRLTDLSGGMIGMAFVQGLRLDTMLFSFLLLPLAFLLTLSPRAWHRPVGWLVRAWALLSLLLVTFVECASFPFFAEYDVRPNIIFVEYLVYPKEVVSMLWKDKKPELAVAAVVLSALVWVFHRQRAFDGAHGLLKARWRHRAVWLLPLVVLLALGIRSSFGHRPANISEALYSPNRVANELAKNSVYSVAYDVYRARKDGSRKAPIYGPMPMDEAYARAHRMFGITQVDPQRPFLRTLTPSHPAARPRNLVLLVQESLGADFVGHLNGGKGVTPSVDALARRSVTFNRLYSNGTRSIRGLSAVSAGFLPVIGEGVLKRPRSQSGFFTLASLLKPLGYHASFIYGGEARFDDMKTWYLGNGFDEVIEQPDYPAPSFVSTWGVSDEDLMLKAHERFMAHHAANRPFVSVVFSSSNHSPFELPEGKIEWEPGVPKFSVRNAIKYADFAVGRFFALAEASPYYKDTVFVVIADHSVRVYGDDAVPVAGFHIPGIVHLAGVAPQQVDSIASQPDVLATALGMIGVPLQAPVLGRSVFDQSPDRPPFVLMQFNDTYGYMRGDEVAVFRPGSPPATHRVRDERLEPAPENPELQRDGLSLLHVTEDLYERRRYR